MLQLDIVRMAACVGRAVRAASGALIAACALTACDPSAFGTGAAAPAPQVTLPSGMTVAGPRGFCILRQARQSRNGAEFAALSPCRAGSATDAAVLTATLGPDGSAGGVDLSPAALTGYFSSRPGLAALARSGNPDAVQIHRVLDANGTTLIHLTDRSAAPRALAQNGEGWRALFGLRGRLVTLSVQAQDGAVIPAQAERRLIDAFVTEMRRVNPEAA